MIQLSGLLGLEPNTSLRRGDKGCRGLAAGLARMQKIQKLVVDLINNKIGPEPRRSVCCRHMRSMQSPLKAFHAWKLKRVSGK